MAKPKYAQGTLLTSFKEGIQAQVQRTSLVPSDWMMKSFRHPKDLRQSWSFADHEFQIDIVNQGDDVQEVSVKKCAQIGLSTIQILWLLTFCAQHDLLKIAYVLPTAKFATEFSGLRVQPIIDQSPVIGALITGDVDNTAAKKIGTCFYVMRGTSGESMAISIDLDALVVDELNFCNQKVLSSMQSRLQHSLLKLKRTFSTPTLPKFGISERYDASSKAQRAVKCNHCEKWVFPDFFDHAVIPGFDKTIREYRRGDHHHPGIDKAYLSCPKCRGELSVGTLNDPARREWVHAKPDNPHKGFAVKFWDVPKYNTVPEVLRSIKDTNYGDWTNFRLGEDYEDSENSILLDMVTQCSTLPVLTLDRVRNEIRYVYIGADLGKTNHIAIGVAGPDGRMHVVCFARMGVRELQQAVGEASLGKYLVQFAKDTLAERSVVDYAPNWEVALYMKGMLGEDSAYGAYYVGDRQGKIDIYEFNDDKGSVLINRTSHFDDLAGAVNRGSILFPMWDGSTGEMGKVREHLSVVKKLKRLNAKGQMEQYWESTSDEDHYAHALGYLWCAYSSKERRVTHSAFKPFPVVTAVPYGKPVERFTGLSLISRVK